MRFSLGTALLLAAMSADGQTKISPRLAESGGSVYLVVFRSGADLDAGRRRVAASGFELLEHPDLRPTDLLVAGPYVRLEALDGDADVVFILPASTDLIVRRRLTACPGAIATNDEFASAYTSAGRGWPVDGTGAVLLHYAIQSLTPKLESNAARSEIGRAFAEWQKHANLRLTESSDPAAERTLAVQFVSGKHGDDYPFDGPKGPLAHTFYPPPLNREPIAGDMHFDLSEDWQIGAAVDLYSVALHEAGHALGLGHSGRPGAVMYPYYRQAFDLTDDDIAAVQAIYGPPAAPSSPANPTPAPAQPAPPPTPTPIPAPAPSQPQPAPSVDRTAPSITITAPASTNVSTSAATIGIAGTASDNVGVTAVKWTTSTGGSGVAQGGEAWTASVPLWVGTTVVTIRAYDAAGNSSWRSLTVSRH